MKIKKNKNVATFVLLILILVLVHVSLAQAAPTFQAAGTAVSGTGEVNPAWPVHQVGDIALLFVESSGGQAATLSTAAGFVAVTNSPQNTGGGVTGTRLTVFWARATSTSMATPRVADPGNHVYAQIITYRGVIANGEPWDVTGGGVKTPASTSVTVTGITTTVPDTLIVQAVSRDNDSAAAAFSAETNPNLTGITERSDTGTTQGNGGGFGVWDGVMATAGATGNTTATVTSSVNAFLTIALQPPTMSTIYAINAAAIYRINSANSVDTIVYNGPPFAPGTQATSLAQCPDGMLYYVENSATSRLYQFNPNTPAVAPTPIGTGLGTGIDNMLRMTCYPTPTVPTGQLYGMYTTPDNLYTINKVTGVATAISLTLPSTTQPIAGSGDIAFDADGTLYYVGQSDTPGGGGADSVRLWIINLETNNFENVGAVTGLPAVANGIAFDNSGNVLLSLTGETRLYNVSADGGAATSIGVAGAMPAVYDLSSVSVLKLTKTDSGTLVKPSDIITYTVTVTAAGAAVNNVVFTDPAVANLNVIAVICAATGGATCPASVTVGGMQGTGLTIPSMPRTSSVTFTITAAVASNPTASMLTNTASVTLSGQTNSASDTNVVKSSRIIKWREIVQ